MSIKVTKTEPAKKEAKNKFPRLMQFTGSGDVFLETSERNGFYLTDVATYGHLGKDIIDDYSQKEPYTGKITLENN